MPATAAAAAAAARARATGASGDGSGVSGGGGGGVGGAGDVDGKGLILRAGQAVVQAAGAMVAAGLHGRGPEFAALLVQYVLVAGRNKAQGAFVVCLRVCVSSVLFVWKMRGGKGEGCERA